MLYLVATPIGNLKDITFRAIETLKGSDYILCEDTRHSRTLLNHYEIDRPLKSYHKFNEASQLNPILEDLKSGKNISLISDAGTPGISDPGSDLVKACVEHKIEVTAIPGPCAAIQALICSGLSTDRFQFFGFLPKKENELKRALQDIFSYKGTTICYESPQRIMDVLGLIGEMDPDRQLVICRELTKKFEEIQRGTANDLLALWENREPKGEFVLLFAESTSAVEWETMTPQEHVEWIEKTYGVSRQEAIKVAAELRGVPKRDIYNLYHRQARKD